MNGSPDPALRAWLEAAAWPLWLAHGIDRGQGAFHEHLDHAGYVCDAPFRRLRVVARQTYVFARAHGAGLRGADEAVALGIDYLSRHAALPDGGYAWRFDLQNRPIDTTRDLYDHAFVLLALASAACVLPPAPLHERARTLLAFIDDAFPHRAGGYVECLPEVPRRPRRQNPHMHLLEALLAAHEAFADPIFLARAEALVTLFGCFFFRPATGSLAEFFDEIFEPVRAGGVFQTEPGHHCEWVWLLDRYQRHAGARPILARQAAALMAFVDRHGVHPTTGDLVDGVGSDGRATSLSARLWPQAERLRAAAIRPGANAAGRDPAASGLAAWLRPDGLWHERRDEHGAFQQQPSPASSLYHLTSGILG